MKLACNYYLETEQLVNEGKIDIDYFKFPSLGFQIDIFEPGNIEKFRAFTERVSKMKPILLHGLYPAPYDLSSDTFIQHFDFDTVNRLIQWTKTPGISFHPTLNPDSAEPIQKIVSTITKNIKFLQQNYSHLDFISIENLDSRRYGDLIDPAVITEIVNETGCRFLLDISHAFCASLFRGENLIDYILKLPIHNVYEIHLNGWMYKDNKVMCHMKIHKEGYDILKELLPKCTPEIITIEYGRSDDRVSAGIPLMSPDTINNEAKEEIIEQVSRIREIIK